MDFVIISFNLNCFKFGFLDFGIFDYYFVYGVFVVIKSKLKLKIVFVKDYKFLDLNEFKVDMVRVLWYIIGVFEDIDDSVFVWEFMFKSIFDNYIKKRIVKIRDRFFFWMNIEIRKVMNW